MFSDENGLVWTKNADKTFHCPCANQISKDQVLKQVQTTFKRNGNQKFRHWMRFFFQSQEPCNMGQTDFLLWCIDEVLVKHLAHESTVFLVCLITVLVCENDISCILKFLCMICERCPESCMHSAPDRNQFHWLSLLAEITCCHFFHVFVTVCGMHCHAPIS